MSGEQAAGDRALGEVEETRPNKRRWWTWSVVVTVVFALVLSVEWGIKNRTELDTVQLVDGAAVEAFLDANWETGGDSDAVTLPTGVFIQSLSFLSASDVHMTGYIWQRRTVGVHDEVEEGFILPEQVDSSVEPREEYRIDFGDVEVIGWYFEGTYRQPFDFRDYPFDHKIVWLRVWPKNFDANVVLVPDLEAYPCPTNPSLACTGREDVFGVEDMIVLGDFERKDTYFDYLLSSYNTDFGIDDYVGQSDFPELRFNMVVKRRFENAFIISLIPLFLVAALAFAALLTVTTDERSASVHGFSTSGVIGTVSALFFVVLLSQIQLRQQFAGSGVVYLEWFYFLMYVALLGVAINTYLVGAGWSSRWRILTYGDNLVAKTTYWPLLIGSMALITLLTLGG